MNLLITSAHEEQAYIILLCLRSQASKIVVAMHGTRFTKRWSGLAPYSRYVHKRYAVPDPTRDWWAGRIQEENTDAEDAYIRKIEAICVRERIDVIFPSFDPEIYVFSKNKQRLARIGVVVVAPEYELTTIPMNKYLTLKTAESVGLPCPVTFFPSASKELEEIIESSQPPWVIKPRFTAHARDTSVVRTPSELAKVYAEMNRRQAQPMVQEFIPGNRKRNYYVVVDRSSEIISFQSPEIIRTRRKGIRIPAIACISSSTGPYLEELRALLRKLACWGYLTIQMKVDSRDDVPKLMEINLRVGSHLWYQTELGVNIPSICVRLAQGDKEIGKQTFPEGVLILDPIDDLRNLGDWFVDASIALHRKLLPGRASMAPVVERDSLGQTLRALAENYTSGTRKVMAPYLRHLLDDPLPCLKRNLGVLGGAFRWRH